MTSAARGSSARGKEAGELRPENGARFVLELESKEVAVARYRVRVETEPAAQTHATLSDRGVELGPWEGAVEPWAVEMALGFCRTVAKNHATAGDWPAVLRRWRSPRDA